MTRNHHCNFFRNTGTNHISNGSPPEIVKKLYINPCIFASFLPGFIKSFYPVGAALIQKRFAAAVILDPVNVA